MAKHIRKTEYNFSFPEEWARWSNENGVAKATYASYTLKQQAKELGIKDEKAIDEYVMAKSSEYWEYRELFDNEMLGVKNQNEQTLLIRNNQLDSTCSVYQRADRILTGLPIDLFLNDDATQSSPAWNDGKNITFNANSIKELDDETVESLHGLNYHEVAHLLFTPRIGTDLGKWIVELDEYGNPTDDRRAHAFNILEDCRAEYYLTTKFPSVRPFLVALLGEYIADQPERMTDNFTLLAGRKYFSLGARIMSGTLYATKYGNEQANLVYNIATEYRTLVFPRDYTRAKELITEFIKVLPRNVNTPSGCGCRPVMRNGRPASEKEQDAIKASDPDFNKSDDLGDQTAKGWGTESGQDTGVINEETAHFNTELDKELLEAVEQAVRTAKADPDLKQRVRDTAKAIVRDSSNKTILNKQNSRGWSPTQADITASRMFGQELERIRIDSDPAWNLEKPTGKLNVRRAMNADVNEINKLFDRWEMGNEDYDIEASILIDRSGSMSNLIGSACRSAWVIKRGIEKINGRVSVLSFNTDGKTVYGGDEKASASGIRIIESTGGTDPYYALRETERIMSQSRAHTKLVFLVTDGQFNGESDKVIEKLKASGIYVSVVYLDEHKYYENNKMDEETKARLFHGAHDFRAISNPIDLVKVAKDVVRANVKGVLAL
jgi:hypothetical protein